MTDQQQQDQELTDDGQTAPDTIEEVVEIATAAEDEPKPKQIVFMHAGASSGGQTLMVCGGLDGCGALVQEPHTERHEQWHNEGLI